MILAAPKSTSFIFSVGRLNNFRASVFEDGQYKDIFIGLGIFVQCERLKKGLFIARSFNHLLQVMYWIFVVLNRGTFFWKVLWAMSLCFFPFKM